MALGAAVLGVIVAPPQTLSVRTRWKGAAHYAATLDIEAGAINTQPWITHQADGASMI
jgi:hypothetical protein